MPRSEALSSLEHFTRLNSSVYIHEPTTTAPSESHPDLILICGWMNASPRHIAKYTSVYERLYPSARILVITTTTYDTAFSTYAANFKRITPILDILYAMPSDVKLLLHTFSNGGSWTSSLIATKYREKIGKPLAPRAVVLDSAPGRQSYEATIKAFTVALPKKTAIRVIGIALLHLFYWLYIIAFFVSRRPDLIEKTRRDLNNKALMDVDTPRLYIYSEADELVAWQHVEQHMAEAKTLGYTVDSEKFLESVHCGHFMRDEKRYWAAVQRPWSTF